MSFSPWPPAARKRSGAMASGGWRTSPVTTRRTSWHALSQVHGGFVAVAAVIARPNQNQYRLLCRVPGRRRGGRRRGRRAASAADRPPRPRGRAGRRLVKRLGGSVNHVGPAGKASVGWQGWRAGRVARSQYRPAERHPGTVPVKSAGRPGRVPVGPDGIRESTRRRNV